MDIEPLFYALFIKDEVWVRVYVNDLPLYVEKADKGRSVSTTLNEYLVPGENTLCLQVLRAPDLSFLSKEQRWTVRFDIYRQADAYDPKASIEDTPKLESLFAVSFPDVMAEASERHRRLPFYHQTRFDNPFNDQPEPIWRHAPEADFDCHGTRELCRAVTELHTALKMRSADAFVDALELKLRHDAAAYGSAAYDRDQRKQLREFIDYGPVVGDLDLSELHFTRLHGGRVAHVTRMDNSYVLDVGTEREPKVRLRMDLLMTQHDGKWCIFG